MARLHDVTLSSSGFAPAPPDTPNIAEPDDAPKSNSIIQIDCKTSTKSTSPEAAYNEKRQSSSVVFLRALRQE
eukprot:1790661-Amphidinium_carterae.1